MFIWRKCVDRGGVFRRSLYEAGVLRESVDREGVYIRVYRLRESVDQEGM